MGQLLLKLNYICSAITSLFLDNGKGRVTPVNETVGPGDPSGFSVFISQMLTAIGNALLSIGEFLLSCIARLVYFAAKIAMNIMDFMNIIVKQLAGQATNYSNLSSNASLEETDILFQFLFNEVTLRILRNVFIFALVLLIIFSIIAIVKQEWENHINGKQNSVKKIFRRIIISVFSLIIVPFVVILGIVFSNVILSSAMSALSGDGAQYSLGAQIFASSSYDANRYRVYASNGRKIPIVFDYDGGFENSVTTEIPVITENSSEAQEQQLAQIKNNGNFSSGQATYNMFVAENFYEFKSISDTSNYYGLYDGQYIKTKQIEYYVMADFLDFAMSSGGTFYLKNVEDIYSQAMNYISQFGIPDVEKDETGYYLVYSVLDNVIAYNSNHEPLLAMDNYDDIKEFAQNYVDGNVQVDHFGFTTFYNSGRADTLSTTGLNADGSAEYRSINGSTDEVTGAKYLFCHRIIMNADGDYLLVPVRVGDSVNGIKFNSSFLEPAPLSEDGKTTLRSESVFCARGVFTKQGYPTAIRQSGGNIVFYRHDPISPSSINYSEIFNYDENNGGQGDTDGSNFVTDALEFFTGVDVSTLVPDVKISLNFMRVFSKTEVAETALNGGKFAVNYSFVGSNLKMPNLYDELKINFIILIFAVVSLFMSFFYIIFGLISRLFEITLLWVTMPGWIAKFPIEKSDQITDGTTFASWKKMMIERVLALYSVYLAVALVLMLLPIVFEFNFIETFNIPETNIFGVFTAETANFVIKTCFILVLLNMLNVSGGAKKTMPRIIEDMIVWSKSNPSKGYISQLGEAAVGDIKKLKNKAQYFVPVVGQVKAIKGAALNVARNTVNFIPGVSIAHSLMDQRKGFTKRNDAMLEQYQKDLLGADTNKDIEARADDLTSATGDHAYMESARQASKDYWRQTGNGKDDFRHRRSDSAKKIAKGGLGTKIKIGNKKTTERMQYWKTRWRRKV